MPMRRLPSAHVRHLVHARVTKIARAGSPAAFTRLRGVAHRVRAVHLNNKPIGKNNVAVLEYRSMFGATSGPIDATSKAKGSAPLPRPRSEGGWFEPSKDPVQDRLMDTDAEYKALSELARRLAMADGARSIGVVHLFTELQPCQSCKGVFEQFREMFPFVVLVVEFDVPYPPPPGQTDGPR